MEISDCTASSSIDAEDTRVFFEAISPIPKGLAAVPDSLAPHPVPVKPNFFVRMAISVALVFFRLATLSFQLLNWFFKTLFSQDCQERLYDQLHRISKTGDREGIQHFLENHANESFAASYLFSEFLDLPELYPHLSEILQGANICLEGDGGFFFRRWSEHPDCYTRISSHHHQKNKCFALDHCLFWEGLDGNTHFQFESSPFRGFFGWIYHTMDFLRFIRDKEQQGPSGTSPHTEEFCIKIKAHQWAPLNCPPDSKQNN